MGWEAFSLQNIRYHSHDLDIEYSQEWGLVIRVDGVVRAKAPRLQRLVIHL